MAEFFQNCWGIKSGLVALCGLKLASNFWMPGVDIVMYVWHRGVRTGPFVRKGARYVFLS